jgi:hypothetical protein
MEAREWRRGSLIGLNNIASTYRYRCRKSTAPAIQSEDGLVSRCSIVRWASCGDYILITLQAEPGEVASKTEEKWGRVSQPVQAT